MCYGIPFQAKGRNDYRKNLIDMLDVIGRKRARKEIQRLADEELTIVVSWEEFATEESILNGPSFWLSFRWKEHDSNRELLTNGWVMWEKQLDQTSLQTTYVEINGSIPQ